MDLNIRRGPIALAGTLCLAALMVGCTGKGAAPAPAETPAAEGASGTETGHPATFEAARQLAGSRGVPILVDFYSPT